MHEGEFLRAIQEDQGGSDGDVLGTIDPLGKFLFGLFYIFLNSLLGLLGYLLKIAFPSFNFSDHYVPMGCTELTKQFSNTINIFACTLTPRYPGWRDFTNFVRDNGVSGTTGQASVQGNLEFIEIHTD